MLLLRLSPSGDHQVALGADDAALRITDLGGGEFGFRDARGQQIVFRSDRVEITTPLKVVMTTPRLEVTGDIVDQSTSNNKSLADLRTAYNLHKHASAASTTDHPV